LANSAFGSRMPSGRAATTVVRSASASALPAGLMGTHCGPGRAARERGRAAPRSPQPRDRGSPHPRRSRKPSRSVPDDRPERTTGSASGDRLAFHQGAALADADFLVALVEAAMDEHYDPGVRSRTALAHFVDGRFGV